MTVHPKGRPATGVAPLVATLMLLPTLGGCVAAVVPVIAGGAMVRQQARDDSETPVAGARIPILLDPVPPSGPSPALAATPTLTPTPAPSATPAPALALAPSAAPLASANPTAPLQAPASAPALAPTPALASASASTPAPASARALPNPAQPAAAASPVASRAPAASLAVAPAQPTRGSGALAGAALWQPFVDYAFDRAGRLGGSEPVQSALLSGDLTLDEPHLLPCVANTPAVLIDLDQGSTPFAPAPGATPVPGLAESLASLREAGVVVLWISQADANRVGEIGDFLRTSGLDPTGRDPLLLARGADHRKQVMRKEANVSVCVLAIAGDRRGDFDELFDYLRDPASAAGLDVMMGSGWFLAPGPFISPSAE